jgi:hypothetical protein
LEGELPLDRARPRRLRTIRAECTTNDAGVWKAEFEYVASQQAFVGTWQFRDAGDPRSVREPCTNYATKDSVRDQGHKGKALDDFLASDEAQRAKLTRAEVALLRMYTGPMFRPLNNALRSQKESVIQPWWTCITVLVCAVFKLSFASTLSTEETDAPAAEPQSPRSPRSPRAAGPKRVYRGLAADGLGAEYCEGGLDFERDGGTELAFMSTTTDRSVAERYSRGKIVMSLELSSTTRAARMEWVSQYPAECEWLLPPLTALTPREAPPLPTAQAGQAATASELKFVATVRVPFSELNLVVGDVDSTPVRAADDLPAKLEVAQLGRQHAGLESALQDELVHAGLTGLECGFFGGCGLSSAAFYYFIGCLFGLTGKQYWCCGTNAKAADTVTALCAWTQGLTCALYASILVMLNVRNYAGTSRKTRGERARMQALHQSSRLVDCVRINAADEDEHGTGVVENPAFEGQAELESAVLGGSAPGPDNARQHVTRQRSATMAAWSPNRWERRAVLMLPRFWFTGRAATAVQAVDSIAFFIYQFTPAYGEIDWSVQFAVPIVAVLCVASVVLCHRLGWAIKLGAKRNAQVLMSVWFFVVGGGLCASNLAMFTPAGTEQNLIRFIFGVLCILLGAFLLHIRRRADAKADTFVAEDKKCYDNLWAEISAEQASELTQLEKLVADANAAAERKTGGNETKVTQADLPGTTMFQGAYLGHLFTKADGWSSEFRQIIVSDPAYLPCTALRSLTPRSPCPCPRPSWPCCRNVGSKCRRGAHSKASRSPSAQSRRPAARTADVATFCLICCGRLLWRMTHDAC